MRTGSPRPRHRRLTWLVAGVAALGLLVGGIAFATIPGSLYGDINGCFKNSNGALRVIDPGAGDSCNPSESPISWSRGYAQEVSRGDVNFSGGASYEAIVGSSLLGGRNFPYDYVVTAKTVIHPNTEVVSECKLVAWRNDIPELVLDESRIGPVSFATHNLQGVVLGPIDVQLRCRASDDWKAEQSTIIGTQVGQSATVVATDADPVSP